MTQEIHQNFAEYIMAQTKQETIGFQTILRGAFT